MHASSVPIGGRAEDVLRRGAIGQPRSLPRSCAFTFLELVIVMLILGIMAAVAVPTFFDSLLYHRVESAARRVKPDRDDWRRRVTVERVALSNPTQVATSSTDTGVKRIHVFVEYRDEVLIELAALRADTEK